MSLKELNDFMRKDNEDHVDLTDLSSFHVFPGPRWHTLSLDEQSKILLDSLLRVEAGDYAELDFKDSYRERVDVKEL